MFCLIYIAHNGSQPGSVPNGPSQTDIPECPQVLEISKTQSCLLSKMQEKSIQQCMDEVGRKNYIDTLEQSDLTQVQFPNYPNMSLKRISETQIGVYRIEKRSVVEKGYLYNSVKDTIEVDRVGNYYVVPIEQWKYEQLPERPKEEATKIKGCQNYTSDKNVVINYDRVLIQLIDAIQKRKID